MTLEPHSTPKKGATDVEYLILGPLEVRIDGETLDLGPKKQRSLFALLLINHNRTVSTDRILDALWGDDAEGKENALWVYVSRLRAILSEATQADVLVTKDHGYAVEIDKNELDAALFDRLVANSQSLLNSDPAAAAENLGDALELWRGNALEEFAYEEWAQAEISRLGAVRSAALDARVDSLLATGAGGELISELEQSVVDRPFDETPVRQLMIALYRAGRQTEALRAFDRFRRSLAEQVGTEPSPELARLEEQVLFHDSRLGTAGATATGHQPNPYRGLAPFKEEDASVFFGRDRLVAELLGRVEDQSIVTLVGPSGSGKSSVVRSGVVPAIRKGSIHGSDQWQVATMIPGSHPFVELEAALLRSRLDTPDSLRAQLDGKPDEILRAVLRVAPTEESTVLIVIDQFEELFTSTDPEVTDRFLTAVVAASTDPRSRARFLVTLRADFYDRPLRHPAFGTAMGAGVVNVVPMAPEELEAAAAGPAEGVGVRLEPALEAALIGDVLGEPGALPLFQFALTDLFDRRVGDTLTLETYRGMGGIEGAVSRKAEHLYARLTADQQEAARQMFLRLVTITDGAANSRRRVEASELLSLDIDPDDLRVVLDEFGAERLLSFDRSQTSGSPTVEVAHEALLSQWDRLAHWISDAQEDVTRNSRLSALSAEWLDSDRDPALLLAGGRFDSYAEWAAGSTMVLAHAEVDFLDASRTAHQESQQAETERVAREIATTRKAKRNARGLAVVIAGVVIVGIATAWLVSRPAGPTVAWVHQADDLGVLVTMERNGFERAARNQDIEYVEVQITGDPLGTMVEVAEEGTDLIVVPLEGGFAADVIASDFPDTDFLVFDTHLWHEADNISMVEYSEYQGSYLMGVAAADASKTGRVGFIGGWQNDYFQDWAASFEDGAKSVSPDVDVLIAWVHEDGTAAWDDPEAAYEAATHLFDIGVDVVFTAAGFSGNGAHRATRDYAESTPAVVWSIGVDADEGYLASEGISPYVLTSMLKHIDDGIDEAIRQWLAGDLRKLTTFDLSNGGIGYSNVNDRFDDTRVSASEQLLIKGEVKPKLVTATPSTWRSVADVTIPVSSNGSACVASPERLRQSDIVEFTLINTVEDDAHFFVAGLVGTPSTADLLSVTEREGSAFAAIEEYADWWGLSWNVPGNHDYGLRWSSTGDHVQSVVVVCGLFTDNPTFSDVILIDP